jgi:DNA-binding NtrC family response regulator
MSPREGRVLVVDDEPQVAAMLNDALTSRGYTVQVAETGVDALRLVPEFCPDVVLLDLALPGIRGEIVLDRLHAADAGLPIVMLTGNQDLELARQTLVRGAFDYIAKPFPLTRLYKTLDAALAPRQ